MRVIYSEPQDVFFQDILTQRVATKMREVFGAADPEFSSWQNSPLYIKNLLELCKILNISNDPTKTVRQLLNEIFHRICNITDIKTIKGID